LTTQVATNADPGASSVNGAEPMRIPLVDLKAQYRFIRTEVDAAIERVLENTSFILGEEVRTFEDAFAHYVGTEETVGVASGTAAIQLALHACGVGPGDEVITTAHTFIATAEPISLLGATPVFVDIEPETFVVDADCVEDAITDRTRVILPVHLYGHPAPMAELRDIADRHGLRLVEDAAQAHGAEYRGSRCGSLGDLACFSFFPGKNLGAYGDGGAVTGRDAGLVARVRRLRDHGRTSKYEHAEVGYGERLDALQAAILGVKLRHLDDWVEARGRAARVLSAGLVGTSVRTPVTRDDVRHAFHLFVIRTERRDELLKGLQERGVSAGVHYPVPLHRQPAYASGCRSGALPETEAAADSVLSLPVYPEITDAQLEYIVEQVRELRP
jgi:dTDP-4-amino-4,6-dideoxygalactose transaminase